MAEKASKSRTPSSMESFAEDFSSFRGENRQAVSQLADKVDTSAKILGMMMDAFKDFRILLDARYDEQLKCLKGLESRVGNLEAKLESVEKQHIMRLDEVGRLVAGVDKRLQAAAPPNDIELSEQLEAANRTVPSVAGTPPRADRTRLSVAASGGSAALLQNPLEGEAPVHPPVAVDGGQRIKTFFQEGTDVFLRERANIEFRSGTGERTQVLLLDSQGRAAVKAALEKQEKQLQAVWSRSRPLVASAKVSSAIALLGMVGCIGRTLQSLRPASLTHVLEVATERYVSDMTLRSFRLNGANEVTSGHQLLCLLGTTCSLERCENPQGLASLALDRIDLSKFEVPNWYDCMVLATTLGLGAVCLGLDTKVVARTLLKGLPQAVALYFRSHDSPSMEWIEVTLHENMGPCQGTPTEYGARLDQNQKQRSTSGQNRSTGGQQGQLRQQPDTANTLKKDNVSQSQNSGAAQSDTPKEKEWLPFCGKCKAQGRPRPFHEHGKCPLKLKDNDKKVENKPAEKSSGPSGIASSAEQGKDM